MNRSSRIWPAAALVAAAVVAWLALDADPPAAPSATPPAGAATTVPATAVSAPPPTSDSTDSSPERTAVATTALSPTPATAERHRIRGTLVVVDGTIEHAREHGSMEVSFRVADPDQPSLPRYERQTLAIVDGAFEFTTPSLPITVSFFAIRAGERDALCADDFAVTNAATRVVVRAKWLQSSLLVRVVADDTGIDLAGLTVVRSSGWHHDRSPHPGERPEPVVANARSPLRLLPRANHATELFWVRAPGYAWNRIELVTTESGERVLRLLPGGDLAVTIDGKIPDGAVLRVRGRPGETPSAERPRRGPPIAEFSAQANHVTIDGLAAHGWSVSLEKGPWMQGPVGFGHVVATVVAGTTTPATLVVRADADTPPMVAVTGTLSLSPAWGREVALLLDATGTTRAWAPKTTTLRLADMVSVDDRNHRWPTLELPAGDYVAYAQGCEFRQLVTIPPTPTTEVQVVVPDPVAVHLVTLDVETGRTIEWPQGMGPSWHMPVEGVHVTHQSLWQRDGSGSFRCLAPAGRIAVVAHPEGYEWSQTEHDVRLGGTEIVLRLARACGVEIVLRDGDAVLPWPSGTQPSLEHVATKTGGTRWSANRLSAKQPGEHVLRMNTPDGYEPIAERRVVIEPGQWTRVEIALRRKT